MSAPRMLAMSEILFPPRRPRSTPAHANQLTVPEISCYSREEIEGGVVIRYMIRQPGETTWQPVKAFRPTESPETNEPNN